MRIRVLKILEIHIKRVKRSLRVNSWYQQDFFQFSREMGDNKEFPILDNYPCLDDRTDSSGNVYNAYFHQDLYVAQQIFSNSPVKHVDIGSRIDGFVAHVAAFRKIEILDIRMLESKIDNIDFKQADLMSPDFDYLNYSDSVSSLHTLEHFGLGRYGDRIDPWGHLKGFRNISNILNKGGVFYFSVPMGIQRIEFNAHRIFSLEYLLNWVTPDFYIKSFSYIDDSGNFEKDVELSDEMIKSSCNCNHGCAVFVLIKK